jgi:hypothetical protein
MEISMVGGRWRWLSDAAYNMRHVRARAPGADVRSAWVCGMQSAVHGKACMGRRGEGEGGKVKGGGCGGGGRKGKGQWERVKSGWRMVDGGWWMGRVNGKGERG